jgi:hypothetical protein
MPKMVDVKGLIEYLRRRSIDVDDRQIRYTNSVATRSLIVAIELHSVTAIGLYRSAISSVTALGEHPTFYLAATN